MNEVRVIVYVDLRPAFVGEPSPLLAPFGSHGTLLQATIARLAAAEIAKIVVVHGDTPVHSGLGALLADRNVVIHAGRATETQVEMILAALEPGASTAVIVDARAAFVSPSVLRAQLRTHRRSLAELTLCPLAPRGLGAIVASREALTKLVPIYAREEMLEASSNPLFACVNRLRSAFLTADAPMGDEFMFLLLSMLPTTLDDVAELAPFALPSDSEEYAPVFDQLSARLWERWTVRSAARRHPRPIPKRPKVLFTHFNTSRQPGSTKVFETLLRHFDHDAFEMVLALPARGELFDHFEQHPPGFPVHRLQLEFLGSPEDPFSDPGWMNEVAECSRLLAEERPDATVNSGSATMALACRLAGIPSLGWLHMPFLLFPAPAASLWGRQSRLAMHDLLVAVGTHYGALLQAVFRPPPGRLKVVDNGIDLDQFQPASHDEAAARRRFGLPADAAIVSVVGLLEGYKRPELALDAFRLVAERVPHARLVFAGEERVPWGAVERLTARAFSYGIQDRVHFLGFVKDVAAVYAATDVLLLCSLGEPFGMVMTEAMAMGRPVVAIDAGGPADVIVDGVTGYLVPPPGEPNGLANAVVKLLGDPQLSARIGAAALEDVHKRFGAPAFARRMEELCRSLIRGDLAKAT